MAMRPMLPWLGVLAVTLMPAGIASAGPISPDALEDLPAVQILILGEVHDNPIHHANQARAVAAQRPAALVFEMVGPEQAARVTAANRTDPAALSAALEWEGSGWPDFGMYFPIVAAAPEARIYGAAVARDQVRRAFGEGAAAVFGPEAARYGLADPLPEAEQAAREANQHEAHCAVMPMHMMPGMVQAQRLRDAEFARTALRALAQTGGPVAVITGTGHARRDWGIPAALAVAAPEVSVLSIGQTEADPGPGAPFDLWIISAPVSRPDPCATLRG
jgi:uncharacterized iron-regulated protein